MSLNMTEMELFKVIHSELIMSMQYIEQDLKIVYATLKDGKFDDNYAVLREAPLGKILKEFRELDKEKGFAKIKESEYQVLEEIREIRNYWAHQCYLDFHYIEDENEHYMAFKKVFEQLRYDEKRVFELQQRMERLRISVVKKYRNR